MIKEYKIYFNNRFVVLSNSVPENPEQKYGLFYKYNGRKQLYKIIHEFEKNENIPSLLLVHSDLKKLWKKFKGYFKYIKAGGGFVQNELGEFLAIRRRGVWDFGGVWHSIIRDRLPPSHHLSYIYAKGQDCPEKN